MKILRNSRGFSSVELIVVLVLITIIAGVGWAVFNRQNKLTNSPPLPVASSRSSAGKTNPNASPLTLDKLFADTNGHYTVRYPSAWTLKSNVDTTYPDAPMAVSTLTSPGGTVIHLKSDSGGYGGACEPEPTDKPFTVGNACGTQEYLSEEVLPIKNVYEPASDGTSKGTSQPAKVALVTIHQADKSNKATYLVGVQADPPKFPIKLHSPTMGAIFNMTTLGVYDAAGKSYPYIYVYATGTDASFLTNADSAAVKEIMRSLNIDLTK